MLTGHLFLRLTCDYVTIERIRFLDTTFYYRKFFYNDKVIFIDIYSNI